MKDKEWDNTFYVLVYKLALEGHKDKAIAELLGVTSNRFTRWIKKKKGLQFALMEARANMNSGRIDKMEDYIYGRLTLEQQEVWDQVKEINREPNPVIKLNRLFEKKGETMRKQLFLNALFRSRFNASQACRKLGISKAQFDRWKEEDLIFAKCITDVEFHKGNFFESSLMRLVDRGNAQAIMMVNRTFNAARGYADVQEIKHSGKIEHEHKSLMDISQLSFKLQQQILAELTAIDKKKEQEQEEADLLEYKV